MPEQALERAEIVNLAGPRTVFGAATTSPRVAAAVARALRGSYDMERLLDLAGRRLAAFHEAEAGFLTHCTAGSLTVAAAACLAGTDMAAVRRLPDTSGLARDRILLMRGHDVDFGGLVSQALRTSGAGILAVGGVNRCSEAELDAALADPRLAGALFVVSPGIESDGLPDLPPFLHLCRRHGVPAIVDAAHLASAVPFLDAGADLVLLSAQKALGGPTAGILVGRADLITACRAQMAGVGRPVKPTKEAVAGVLAALDAFPAEAGLRDRRLARRRARLLRLLRRFPGIALLPAPEETRVRFSVDAARLGRGAGDIASALAAGRPPVRLRDDRASSGILEIDLSVASPRAFSLGLAALRAALEDARRGGS